MNNGLVDEIKSRCNIVDVVGNYVALKRTGSSYKGLCPFHNEKTPSFNVNENMQHFHCFGCGESGDVISFIQRIENLDFMDACRKLADMYSIDIDRFGYRDESRKNRIYEMNRDAARFFFRKLTEGPNPGYDYVVNRQLDPKTIKEFGIGYAPDGWHNLYDHMKSLKEKNYTDEELEKAGLLSRSKGRYYDKFRNRVMFPIIDTRGKVIGFGGRIIGDGEPKYLNSPESEAFQKKNNLFGLNLTRNHVSKEDEIILVEGYMDMVSLYKNGVKNVAASLGTALTENQCRLISRYTKNVVLSYDADSAGRKAALRGIEIIRGAGMKAKVLHVPDGKDPDEFVKKHGSEKFTELVGKALPYAEYKLQNALAKYDLQDTEQSISFFKEAAGILETLSPIESDRYIKRVSQKTGISETALRREIEAIRTGKPAGNLWGKQNNRNTEKDGKLSEENDQLQRYLIRLIAEDVSYIQRIENDHMEEIIRTPAYFNIYNRIKTINIEKGSHNGVVDIRSVQDSLDPVEADTLQRIMDDTPLNDSLKIYEQSRSTFRRKILERRRDEISDELGRVDDSTAAGLTSEIQKIDEELKTLKG
ncbi:MAG: DNA primase [Clostridia bacterium]|nr:DNA primase [Clostridia bacterium]